MDWKLPGGENTEVLKLNMYRLYYHHHWILYRIALILSSPFPKLVHQDWSVHQNKFYLLQMTFKRLELPGIAQSTSNRKSKEGWGCRGRWCKNQIVAISHLLSEERPAREGDVLAHIQQIVLGKKTNCSVVSYKWVFVDADSYEEDFIKPKEEI